MKLAQELEFFRAADNDGTANLRGLLRIARRVAKRCWIKNESILERKIFCQNSGACGSTYIIKLLHENGIQRAFHEKTPDLLELGLQHFESPLAHAKLVRLLRYTRHDAYFEANNRLFSLTLPLAEAFPNARFLFLHRDPAEAVRSAMSKPDLDGYFANNSRFQGTLAGSKDDDDFKRFCLHWANMNELIHDDLYSLAQIEKTTVELIRFEDLINGKVAPLERLLEKKLKLESCQPANVGPLGTRGKFPAYPDWTPAQKETFDQICGPVAQSINNWAL